jgi:GNAT superfamily N-acetyltransferase
MGIASRPYTDLGDLSRIQRATAHWIARTNPGCYIHPGDLALRLFKGMRRYDPPDIIRLWESPQGDLLGWALVYPPWNSFEMAVQPDQLGSGLAAEILAWTEAETWDWMKREGRSNKLHLELYEGDVNMIALAAERGYRRTDHRRLVSARSLADPIPDASLPAGFIIRSVAGEHEAEHMVAVQNAAFGWQLMADDYRRVMASPIYRQERELVVVAPDGRFAAFCTLLLDADNQIGMFEDVGTHADFRRLGLGRALLYAGMHRLRLRGMTTALVPHQPPEVNEAAAELYAQVGFTPQYIFWGYNKNMPG